MSHTVLVCDDAIFMRTMISDILTQAGFEIVGEAETGVQAVEKFRQLNVRNLGVGDAWDVLSGVDMLIAKGWVDPAKVGCMGWSQGGYISAFLTTSTTRFAAISVGRATGW